MNIRLLLICCFSISIMTSCTMGGGVKTVQGDPHTTPFNYNSRKTYVFAVKIADPEGNGNDFDTLDLMCANVLCRDMPGQSVISWAYLSKSNNGFDLNKKKISNEYTGIISSDTELFLHPPRGSQYILLETCPFPYVFFPLFVGKKWDWSVDVGSHYCPDKNIRWNGIETFKSTYEVMDTETVEAPVGKAMCFHIHANCTAKVGASSADFFYNHKLGLVKLSYSTLSKMNIELSLVAITDDESLFKIVFWRLPSEGEKWLFRQQNRE